jgi:hypothetical protein
LDKLVPSSLPALIERHAQQPRFDIQIDCCGRIGGIATIAPPKYVQLNRTVIRVDKAKKYP